MSMHAWCLRTLDWCSATYTKRRPNYILTTEIQRHRVGIRALDCNNAGYWNSYRFSVIRKDYIQDFTAAVRSVVFSDYDHWHKEMDDVIIALGQAVVTDSFHKDTPVETRAANLELVWEECKTRIDELMRRRS